LKKSDAVDRSALSEQAGAAAVANQGACAPSATKDLQMTIRPIALFFAAALLAIPAVASAQGVPRGAQTGARVGNEAAGPVGGAVGGVVGGVAGGVAGGVKGVLGVPQRTAVRTKHQRRHYNRHRTNR
jgi:hypothetical protein